MSDNQAAKSSESENKVTAKVPHDSPVTKRTKSAGTKKSAASGAGKKVSRTVKKKYRKLTQAKVFIRISFNNARVTITDISGNVIVGKTAGQGYKGSRKSTPFAAQTTAEAALFDAVENFGIQEVLVYVSGPGAGREAAVRVFVNNTKGVKIKEIWDITPIPHNGPQPPKKRRV